MVIYPFYWNLLAILLNCMLVCSVMSNCLQSYGLQPNQAPLFTEFPRHEYWSGLPFPIPGDLPDAEIKPCFPCLLHWLADSLPLCHLGILILEIVFHYFKVKVILPFPTSLLCQHKFSYLGYFLLFTNLTPSSPSQTTCSLHLLSSMLCDGLPQWLSSKEFAYNAVDVSLIPFYSRKIHWRRAQQPTPVFLPGESHTWQATVHGFAKNQAQLK